MLFIKSLALLLLPTYVLASPAANPEADVPTAVLLERQGLDLGNLTGLLGSLTGSIQAIESLLAPSSLNNIEAVVTVCHFRKLNFDILIRLSANKIQDLADLLGNGTAGETKSLITAAGGLLSGNLITQIEGLLTPQLITNLTDILGNAHDLLTPTFVSQTTELIGDVAPVSL